MHPGRGKPIGGFVNLSHPLRTGSVGSLQPTPASTQSGRHGSPSASIEGPKLGRPRLTLTRKFDGDDQFELMFFAI